LRDSLDGKFDMSDRIILLETEQRVDFTRRWSGVFFGGVAKAFDEYSDFGDAELVYG
jgi:hypothetical protein